MKEVEVSKSWVEKDDFDRITEQFKLDLEKVLWENNGNTSVRYSIHRTEKIIE